MKYVVSFIVEDEKEKHLSVEAFGTDSAAIFITAPTLPEAKNLLPAGEEMARAAMRKWKPAAEKPIEDTLHGDKTAIRKTIAQMEADKTAYEATAEGGRFAKTLDNAVEFTLKHCGYGVRLSQLNYLANRFQNNLIDGSFSLFSLGFRQGYSKGKKKA